MTQEKTQPEATPGAGAAGTTIAEIRCEHLSDAFGIGTVQPRLSWIVATAAAGWRQSGYEIEAYAPTGQRRAGTGQINSDQAVA